MQDNELTLSVDILNDGNPADQIFSRSEEYLNRTVYESADHTLVAPDTLTLYRTRAKTSGNFNGMAKTAAKLSKAVSVAGVDETTTVKAPIIQEVSSSVPVGATKAQVVAQCQRTIALLDDDAFVESLMLKQSI